MSICFFRNSTSYLLFGGIFLDLLPGGAIFRAKVCFTFTLSIITCPRD